MNDIEELIEEFNSGDWNSISKIFNNKIEVFLSFILRKGLIDELDLSNIPYNNVPSFNFLVKTKILDKFEYRSIPELLENDFLLYKIQQDPEVWLEWLTKNEGSGGFYDENGNKVSSNYNTSLAYNLEYSVSYVTKSGISTKQAEETCKATSWIKTTTEGNIKYIFHQKTIISKVY